LWHDISAKSVEQLKITKLKNNQESCTFGLFVAVTYMAGDIDRSQYQFHKFCRESGSQMVPYPATFPSDAVALILANLKTGADKAKIAEALWNLLGYAAKEILGESVTNFSAISPEPLSEDEEKDVLASLQTHDAAPAGSVSGIDPKVLFKFAFGLLQKLLSGLPLIG